MKKIYNYLKIFIIIFIIGIFTGCPNILTDEIKINEQDEALKQEISDNIIDIIPEVSDEIDKILVDATSDQLVRINDTLNDFQALLRESYAEYEQRTEQGLESEPLSRYLSKTGEEGEADKIDVVKIIKDVFGDDFDQFLDIGFGFNREFLLSLGLGATASIGVGASVVIETVGGKGEAIDFRNFTRYTYETNSVAADGVIVAGPKAGAGPSFEVSGIISDNLLFGYKQNQQYEKSTFAGGGITGGISGDFIVGLGVSASATYNQDIASSWDVEESDILEIPSGDPIGLKSISFAVKATSSVGPELGVSGSLGGTGVYGNNRPVEESIHHYLNSDKLTRADYFLAGSEMAKDVLFCHNLPPTGSLLNIAAAGMAIVYGVYYDSDNFSDDNFVISEVIYKTNGATSGTVPRDFNLYEPNEPVTVSGNTGNLQKTGAAFLGWRLTSDGSGSLYTEDDIIDMGLSALVLYAAWDDQGEEDTTPPAEVSNLNAVSGDGQVTLSWTDPADSDFDHVEIWYGEDGVSDTQFPGTVDSSGTVITGLTNLTEYTFTVKTIDDKDNISAGAEVSSIPATASNFSVKTISSSTYSPNKIISIDFDHDGDLDICVNTYSGIYWLDNQGENNFIEREINSSTSGYLEMNVFDIDNDNDYDIVAGSTVDDELALWRNENNTVFNKEVISTSYTRFRDIESGDLDADGDVDLIVIDNIDTYDMSVFKNDGSGTFSKVLILDTSLIPDNVVIEDLDDDGYPDIVGVKRTDKLWWWKNNGTGGFTQYSIPGVDYLPEDLLVSDLDLDGDLDIFTYSSSSNIGYLFFNDGNETFSYIKSNSLGITGGSRCIEDIEAADIDSDGDQDIIVSVSRYENVLYENNGDFTFTQSSIGLTPGSYDILIDDIDDDGDYDIVSAQYYGEQVVIWENLGM